MIIEGEQHAVPILQGFQVLELLYTGLRHTGLRYAGLRYAGLRYAGLGAEPMRETGLEPARYYYH